MDNLVFTESEYNQRQNQLLENLDTDFGIIFNRPDMFYYSNTGMDGLITIDGELTRYVRRNEPLAHEESILPAKLMDSFRLFKEIAKEKKVKRLGLELDLLPHRTVEYILRAFDNPELVDISGTLRNLRSRKSNAEQDILRLAMDQTDASFVYIEDKIKPGVTELELSAKIEYFLRREGHPGFVNVRMFHHNLTSLSYVMSGESTATLNSLFGPVSGQGLCKIHKNGPSKRKIKNNEAILIDTTGVVEGYTGDETRTFFLGSPDNQLMEGYELAKSVQEYAGNIMKAGASTAIIYENLNRLVQEMGMIDNFMGLDNDKVPFIGHGVGLELDDLPIITDKYNRTLEEGNVVALEPKFIFRDPNSGVGIEDCWIIGKHGAERITNYPW